MRYTSDDDELRSSTNTPAPSEDPASASSKSKKGNEDDNYHLHVSKKMKQVAMCLASLTIYDRRASLSRVKKKREEKNLQLF